ncbi:MAG: DNA-processing protein DprA [Candidatus Omnitrophica bacterium]|nr:DNA-processing protein DprA [Candidatus Omnitrophota bacterium]
MNETDALLVLNAWPWVTNLRKRKLLDHFGSAQEVLRLSEKDFIEQKLASPAAIKKIFQFDRDKFLKSEYNLISKHQARILVNTDARFPGHLKEIPDCPIVLYIKGELPQDQGIAIAMVGSRRSSIYGIGVAEKFSARLAELGITIVSGMARGIDTAAHKGCLNVKGKTVAVLGCGLNHVYPPENNILYTRIVKTGAVISEFPMDTPPVAYNFPRRNRIVSGLTLGVVVVEASTRSGALITSRCALEQGREVFAVPGKVDAPNAQGTHRLIKEGAKLISSVEDILEELNLTLKSLLAPQPQGASGQAAPLVANLSCEEEALYQHMDSDPVYIDDLMSRTRGAVKNIMNTLLRLEIKKLIKQLPGKFYIKN